MPNGLYIARDFWWCSLKTALLPCATLSAIEQSLVRSTMPYVLNVHRFLFARSLIAMASDEVGVELGVDTVEKCKVALQEAEELQVG